MIPELENAKDELEKAINDPTKSMEEITDISKRIDELIATQYILQDNNSNIEKKYAKLFERKDRTIILTQIKSDILDNIKDISLIELELLATNIYDFCCLTIHHKSDSEIQEYFSYKNRLYCSKLSDEQIRNMIKVNLQTINKLSQKYTKILKSNKDVE